MVSRLKYVRKKPCMHAAIGVIVGVVFAILQIRDLTKARQAALAIQLNPWFRITDSELLEAWTKTWSLEFKDYNDFVKKHGSFFPGKPIHKAIAMVLWFYGVGTLLHRKLIDLNRIEELVAGVTRTWEKVKPIVEGVRKNFNDPKLYEWFEYLYNEMQKREQRLQQTQR